MVGEGENVRIHLLKMAIRGLGDRSEAVGDVNAPFTWHIFFKRRFSEHAVILPYSPQELISDITVYDGHLLRDGCILKKL